MSKLLWSESSNYDRCRMSYYCLGVYRIRLWSKLDPHFMASKAEVQTQIEVLNSSLDWKLILVDDRKWEDLEKYALSNDTKTIIRLIDEMEEFCLTRVVMLLDGA